MSVPFLGDVDEREFSTSATKISQDDFSKIAMIEKGTRSDCPQEEEGVAFVNQHQDGDLDLDVLLGNGISTHHDSREDDGDQCNEEREVKIGAKNESKDVGICTMTTRDKLAIELDNLLSSDGEENGIAFEAAEEIEESHRNHAATDAATDANVSIEKGGAATDQFPITHKEEDELSVKFESRRKLSLDTKGRRTVSKSVKDDLHQRLSLSCSQLKETTKHSSRGGDRIETSSSIRYKNKKKTASKNNQAYKPRRFGGRSFVGDRKENRTPKVFLYSNDNGENKSVKGYMASTVCFSSRVLETRSIIKQKTEAKEKRSKKLIGPR